MKKLYSTLTAGVLLLGFSAASLQATVLFWSDMSPPGHNGSAYAVDNVPDQWWPDSTGDGVAWMQNADGVQPGNTNDFFLQGTQGSEGVGNVTLRSRWFENFNEVNSTLGSEQDMQALQGTPFTITFDIAISDGATGRLDFRMDQFNVGVSSGIIYNSGFQDVGAEWVGEQGAQPTGAASIESLGTSVDNFAWHRVTLTGTFDENFAETHSGGMDIFFEPWQFGGGTGDNTAHFVGDYRVDNVSVIPEPSTYAMIVGFLALGGCLLRRRFRRNG